MDYVGPAIGAGVFVLIMSLVHEPARRTFNAVLIAGASGVYLSGGHAAWDLPHHFWGHPIWPFMPTSSFGCVIFDTLVAFWFLAGAPSLGYSAKTRWTNATAIEPSPTADATRLMLPPRTSPTANTPGRLVSRR